MFRRLVAIWLMLSILGYGMAVTADVHNESVQSHDHVLLLTDTHTDSDPVGQEIDCDHCCHGLAHMLGLVSEAEELPVTGISLPIIHRSKYPCFIFQAPAFRPPIAV